MKTEEEGTGFDFDASDIVPEEDFFDFNGEEAEPVKAAETPLVESPERILKPQAKTGVPNVEEWQDFIGRFVLRGLTRTYLSFALRDIEDDLTPHEREMIQLSSEDLSEMAAPIASFASKNKFARKHGRKVISAADSSESFIAIAIWMRRVNRIAKKHRVNTVPGVVTERTDNGNPGTHDVQGVGVFPDGLPFGGDFFNPGSG